MNFKSIKGRIIFFVLFVFISLGVCFGYFLNQLSKAETEIKRLNTFYGQEAIPADNASVTSSNAANTGAGNDNSIAQTLTSINQRHDVLFYGIAACLIAMFLILGAGAYWIIHAFTRSLKNPALVLNNLVQGNTSLTISSSNDEFTQIVNAANQLNENLKRSSNFAQSIGEGNFDFNFKPVSDQDTLGNSLLQMREKLKSIAGTDKKRNWANTGLAMFADLIRKEEDKERLSDALISQLVKHTKSNQGGLFTVNRENKDDIHLELIACYAFERKKHFTKRVDIGSGLLGQCFLEGTPIYLTQVPPNYVSITSGLGNSDPSSLLIVPLKLNDVIEGVIELASFRKYEQHEIDFVSRVGEVIASAIVNARNAEITKKMLDESQQQSEQLRAQEEEMRQNMEEMQATQEALERQSAEMKRMQGNLELEKSMFGVLMEMLPDRITYKDADSRILRINKAKAKRLNMNPEEVVGKTDFDFFTREHAEKAMREEKTLIESGRPLIDIEEKLTFNNGDSAWVTTSRIPFKNEHNVTTGMFIITRDITKQKNAELSLRDRDNIIQKLLSDLPVFHYKIDKDKVISDVWVGKIPRDLHRISELISQPLKNTFPKVYESIDKGVDTGSIIEETLSITGDLIVKHYIFNDSIHPDTYWVYALIENRQ